MNTTTREFHQDRLLDGLRWVYTFPNGYGASIICNSRSYGGDLGYFEIAVLHHDHICYGTELTNDVLGGVTFHGVAVALDQIEALPDNPICNHRHKYTFVDDDPAIDDEPPYGSFPEER